MKRIGVATKVGIAATALVAGVILLSFLAVRGAFKEEYETFRSVQPGMSEEQVIQLLGKPYKVYEKDTAPKNYYVEGYAFKQRPITNKVYIYVASEPIAYVYFNKDNKVEEIFIGGS
jgi:outer membrane protein assembly factor BamE (lipoprotein component of BamABCDE complex)